MACVVTSSELVWFITAPSVPQIYDSVNIICPKRLLNLRLSTLFIKPIRLRSHYKVEAGLFKPNRGTDLVPCEQ